jgi:hypothetical protein
MSATAAAPAKRRRQGSVPGVFMVGLGAFVLWTFAIGLSTPLTLAGGVLVPLALAAWTRAADL